ncbi:MAG: polysaccharide deacetylase [Deltaproteobacteria bacterium]|nr:polysaccharide deacetylase [Deltaproteobacteria bacterium]
MSCGPKKISSLFLSAALVFLLAAPAGSYAAAAISAYRGIFKPFNLSDGKFRIAIRQFNRKGKQELLTVDPSTFETFVEDASGVDFSKAGQPARPAGGPSRTAGGYEKTLNASPFIKALTRYSAPPVRLQNHGITKAENTRGGVFLTVDLCPSKRPFDRDMFLAAIEFSGDKIPAPMAIAITGAWIKTHKGELTWILEQVKARKLDVTWINHSYSHPYSGKGKPLTEDFLLTRGVDFEKEVLDNESLMLDSGITPSPFFRFPGLASDGRTMKKLKELSLIPVGADAWLAKGETPSDGSIILVHGNGNEPRGIEKLLEFYKREKGRLELLPVKDAF